MRNLVCVTTFVVLASLSAFAQAQEKVLWSFGSGTDGNYPVGGLIADAAGNLYGTTPGGGSNIGGTVFELLPHLDGSWSEVILYNFCSQLACTDGLEPQAGLVMDEAGNLYGTTQNGGTQAACGGNGCGTVFELSPAGGVWVESVLYNFCSTSSGGKLCTDGYYPFSQLVFDGNGNLYGTTEYGGNGRINPRGGTVFELSPGSDGWTESALYSFCSLGNGNFCTDGEAPVSAVTLQSGNIFGTTTGGGKSTQGLVYELYPNGNDWTEKILTTFYFVGSSFAPVSFDKPGNLYTTTEARAFQLNAAHQSGRSRGLDGVTGDFSHAGILIDPRRNALFGTATVGGANTDGTVWEVNSSRQLGPVYSFCAVSGCADGAHPYSGLIEDPAGNLYGTTQKGGANGVGVVFEITP